MYTYNYSTDSSNDKHSFNYIYDFTGVTPDKYEVKDFIEAIAQHHFENHLGDMYEDSDWPIEFNVTNTDGNFICSGTVIVEFEPTFSAKNTIVGLNSQNSVD